MTRLPWQAVACAAALTACEQLPGRPVGTDPATAPATVAKFDELYGANCAGCHGADGRHGAAQSLNDPAYLAIESDSALHSVTANGVSGTLMPAFSRNAGGTLSDAEVTAIVHGIRTTWGKGDAAAGAPTLSTTESGDATAGAQAYATFCAGCHGPSGHGGSVTDASYLALVSDQWLRTVIIVGRPELGMPDWRGDVPGRPLTDREIADIVAWLATHRVPFPGQPYRPQS
ncbi:MAG TPA: c-type cytochrome [Gemmatimonadaceae bacterium]|jgi:cytochrome c oxidase cbb3-type subunit 3|nr:c-type cytochrome [Gemmatimonadaceae bacterium]